MVLLGLADNNDGSTNGGASVLFDATIVAVVDYWSPQKGAVTESLSLFLFDKVVHLCIGSTERETKQRLDGL